MSMATVKGGEKLPQNPNHTCAVHSHNHELTVFFISVDITEECGDAARQIDAVPFNSVEVGAALVLNVLRCEVGFDVAISVAGTEAAVLAFRPSRTACRSSET